MLRRKCRPGSVHAGYLPRKRHKEAAFHPPIFGEVCLTGRRTRLLHILSQGSWPIVRHDCPYWCLYRYLCNDATRHQSEESRHLSKSVTSHCWSRGSPYSTTVAVPGFKLSLKVRTFCRLGLKPGRVYDKAFSCFRYHNYDNF